LADVQRIVIELSADTTELQPAIDQLEALGQIDAKSAELFKKTNAAINERAKTLATVNTAQKAVTEGSKQTAASYEKLAAGFASASKSIAAGASSEVVKGFFEGVQDALDETGVSVQEFEQRMSALADGGGLNKAETGTKSLKQQLRELKNELATLNPTDARFQKLAQEAGELEDKIGDVNLQVRNLASDTSALDGVIGSIQGVAGAFQVVEGSAALFGDTSKELQETLVRLTALMNITNGLQGIQNLLQRQSAATLLITNAQRSISASLIALEGAAESKNIVIRYAAVAAQKLLNAVMAANPAGLLVVALGALAGALLYFSDSADSAAEAQIKLNEAQLESIKTMELLDESFSKANRDKIRDLQIELDLVKARNGSAIEQLEIELKIANAKRAQAISSAVLYEDQREDLDKLNSLLQDQLQALEAVNTKKREGNASDDDVEAAQKAVEATNARIKQEERLRDLIANSTKDQKIAQQNLANAQADAQKDAEKARLDALEKERAANRAAQLQKLQDEKAFIETSLIEVEKGTEAELNLKLALIQKEAQIGLFSLEGTKNTEEQRLLIIAQAGEKAKEIKLDAEREVIAAIYAEQEKLNNVDQNKIAAQLAATEAGSLAELQLKKDAIEAIADAEKLAAQKKFQDSKQTVTDSQVFATEIVKIDAEAIDKRKELDQEYYDNQQQLREQALAAEQEVQDQIIQSTLQVIGTIADAYYKSEQDRIQKTLQDNLSALNKRKNAELNNKKLTESQKADIEEKYRKLEAQQKLKAWNAERDAKLGQAIINTALAVTAAIATGPPQGYILAVTSAALGAIEIASILAQKPPQFKDGTEYVKGPGTSRSDSVHAMLSVGERVFSAETSAKYAPALNKIQRGQISPEAANSLLNAPMMEGNSFRMKPVTQDMVQQSIQFTTGKEMDYKKAAKAYAEEQWSDLDNLNDSMIANRRAVERVEIELRNSAGSNQNTPRNHRRPS